MPIFVRKPIERCVGWPLAHVSEEVVEHAPPLAHLDATTAVSREPFGVRIFAPRHHRSPRAVGPGVDASNCVPVGDRPRCRHVSDIAAAGRGVPDLQMMPPRDQHLAAFAAAFPTLRAVTSFDRWANHSQPTKYFSSQLKHFHPPISLGESLE